MRLRFSRTTTIKTTSLYIHIRTGTKKFPNLSYVLKRPLSILDFKHFALDNSLSLELQDICFQLLESTHLIFNRIFIAVKSSPKQHENPET